MLKTFLRPPRCLLISEMWTGLKRAADAGRCDAYVYAHVYFPPKTGIKPNTFYPCNVFHFVPLNAVCFAFHSSDMEAVTPAVVMVTFAQRYLFLSFAFHLALVPWSGGFVAGPSLLKAERDPSFAATTPRPLWILLTTAGVCLLHKLSSFLFSRDRASSSE